MGGGCIIGNVDDWEEIFPGEKGKEMNKNERELNARPWELDLDSHPSSYSYDDQHRFARVISGHHEMKKTEKSRMSGGSMVPCIVIEFLEGLPVTVKLYDPIKNYKKLTEAREFGNKKIYYDGLPLSSYNTTVTYRIIDPSLQQQLKLQSEKISKDMDRKYIDDEALLNVLKEAETQSEAKPLDNNLFHLMAEPKEKKEPRTLLGKLYRDMMDAKEEMLDTSAYPTFIKHDAESRTTLAYKS